ncbi:MAG: TIGR02996 domain-containing protein [Myxococcota bacterium]
MEYEGLEIGTLTHPLHLPPVTDHDGLLAELLQSPHDPALLVYADWLEAHSDPRASYTRGQLALRTAEGEARRAALLGELRRLYPRIGRPGAGGSSRRGRSANLTEIPSSGGAWGSARGRRRRRTRAFAYLLTAAAGRAPRQDVRLCGQRASGRRRRRRRRRLAQLGSPPCATGASTCRAGWRCSSASRRCSAPSQRAARRTSSSPPTKPSNSRSTTARCS